MACNKWLTDWLTDCLPAWLLGCLACVWQPGKSSQVELSRKNKLQSGLTLDSYSASYAQCELLNEWRRQVAKGCQHCLPLACVCVCESKTQKWFLTFQLINLLQLNTFNDFWRWRWLATVLATFRFICLFYLHLLCSLSCWLKIVRPQGSRRRGSGKLWEASLPFFAVIFSNWFNMRACLCVCVHACACACDSLKFSYFISFHLCFRLCFAFVAVALSLFPALPHFVASFHNDTLWGAAQFVCGLYAIFHLDPATPRISLM